MTEYSLSRPLPGYSGSLGDSFFNFLHINAFLLHEDVEAVKRTWISLSVQLPFRTQAGMMFSCTWSHSCPLCGLPWAVYLVSPSLQSVVADCNNWPAHCNWTDSLVYLFWRRFCCTEMLITGAKFLYDMHFLSIFSFTWQLLAPCQFQCHA